MLFFANLLLLFRQTHVFKKRGEAALCKQLRENDQKSAIK